MSDPAASRDEDLLLEVLACREEEPEAGEDRWLSVVPDERRGAVRERLRRLDEVAGSLGRRDESAPDIPGYRLEHEAGRGALGVVYAAQDETLQRRVALKVLRTPARRVIEEARRVAALRNPAIVTVHSVAEGEDATAIVMEWVDGRPLDEMARPLGWRQRTRLLAQVARGLAAAHGAGIVHRDLKPDNVLVTPLLQPKILDFGLAQRGVADASGVFQGTPAYASPEQAAGDPVGPPSDVFSFGVMMFEILTGRRPFEGDTVSETLRSVREDDPPFPRRESMAVPEGLQSVCLACLARDPDRRPDAARVAADLGRWLSGDEVRMRPALYGDVLRRKVSTQLDEVGDWQGQGMISSREGDALRSVFRRILADEDHWILDARRLSVPQVLVNAGAWLVVVALALVVWLGREALPAWAAWAVPVGGSAVLCGAGLLFHLRREVETAAPFLAGAVLSLLPTVLCVQAEMGWLAERPEGVSQLLGESYSNLQLCVASAAAFALSIVSLAMLRFTALAWTTAVLAAVSWWSWRVVHGWLDEPLEWQAIWSLPLCSALVVALCFEFRGRVRWAMPFHLLALGVCVLALDTIAVYGPSLNLIGWAGELSHARQEGYSLAANGLFFLGCTLLFARCGSLDLRRGALMLEVLVPIHLLGALYETALEEGELVDLWVYVGVVLAVLMLGALGNHRRLLYGGLLGLAFGGHLPLALDLVEAIPYALWLGAGGLAVALGTRGWIGR